MFSSKLILWLLAGTTIAAGVIGYYVVSPQLIKSSDTGYGSIVCPKGQVRQDKQCVSK